MADSPVALVTGASSGIGENLAFGLAEDGYQVVLGARSEGQLKKVAERISSELSLTSRRIEGKDGAAAILGSPSEYLASADA